jgi:PAS domain S-box-containing protein
MNCINLKNSINQDPDKNREYHFVITDEKLHRTLFENMPQGFAYCQMVFTDGKPQDFIYLNVNSTFENLTGTQEVVGKRMTEVIPDWKKSNPGLLEIFGRVASTGIKERTNIYLADSAKWFSASVYGRGKGYFIAVFVDITESKQAEEKLRLAAQEWRTTFDSITDMVFIRDREGKITRMNRAFANGVHKAPQELIGMSCCEVIHGTKTPPLVCPFQKVHLTKRPSSVEYFEPFSGLFIQESVSPVLGEEGEMSGSVNIIRDITEKKKLEEQLIMTDRLVTIGELAAGVAHELNNPLTSVIGFSQLILEGETPAEIRSDLNIIRNEAQRAAKIVKNLLTFGRKHKPVKQFNQVNDCINEVLSIRAYEHKCRNIKVINRLNSNLPGIMFDYFQMQQVFINLIINAEYFMIRAHNGGRLKITSRRSNEIVRVSISHDGPGMTEDTLKHLFNPFFTTKEVGQGTGLGLAICHGIVSEHQGKIYARSEHGKGATFIVELPVQDR